MPKKSEYQESRHVGPESAILICDPRYDVKNAEYTDLNVTVSPIRCLDRVTEEHPGIVVVRFTDDLVPERKILVELCAALKRNRHSRESRILALLPTKHRLLLEELKQAGVDYVWIEESPGLDTRICPALSITLVRRTARRDYCRHFVHFSTMPG